MTVIFISHVIFKRSQIALSVCYRWIFEYSKGIPLFPVLFYVWVNDVIYALLISAANPSDEDVTISDGIKYLVCWYAYGRKYVLDLKFETEICYSEGYIQCKKSWAYKRITYMSPIAEVIKDSFRVSPTPGREIQVVTPASYLITFMISLLDILLWFLRTLVQLSHKITRTSSI